MSETGIAVLLGQHLLITTVLAAIAYLICRTVRLSPATRHVLWLLVLCRLMIPPVATWPWSISIPSPEEPATLNAAETESRPLDSNGIDRDRGGSSAVVSMTDAVPAAPGSADRGESEAWNLSTVSSQGLEAGGIRDESRRGWTILSFQSVSWVCVFLWASGTMMAALILTRRFRSVYRLLRTESHEGAWLQSDIDDWSQRLDVRPPHCVVTAEAEFPFLWCLGRVRLIWPLMASHIEQRGPARPILVHELAHLKRRDHLTAWVETFAMAVWWWNPVFWFVHRQLRAEAELACDAWVVKLLPDQRRTYAETLVDFSGRARSIQLAVGAVGAGGGSRRTFARRLEMIMNETTATRFSKSTALAAILLAVVSIPILAVEREAQSTSSNTAVCQIGQVEQTLGELFDQFNELFGEQRFSEAAVLAQQAQAMNPDSSLTLAMLEKSKVLTDEKHPAGFNSRNSKQSTDSNKRVVEFTKKQVVRSPRNQTGDENAAGGAASLTEVLSHIEKSYYGSVDRRELERVAIEAILSKLDDRSSLLSPEAYEQMKISVDGNLVGVGIAIHLDAETGQPVVTRPIRNSPGQAAGLHRNDVILSVNGASTEGLSLKELIQQIRGPSGSPVTLGVRRADQEFDIKVIRERFETSVVNPLSVTDDRDNYWADRAAGIGYVHIPSFTRHSASQLRKALVALSNQGMKGLVLDLRDCGGGLMSAAAEVVDMFIDEGVILSSQGRNEDENLTFQAQIGGEYIDLPLAVLMNGNTASAAEIVAAALQDHHRAATIGEQTYGRGTVQAIFQLRDGGALRLTTAAWLRPNGRTLLRREGDDGGGVRPDAGLTIPVTDETHERLAKQRESRLNGDEVDDPIEDPQLNKALSVLSPIE